MPDASPARVLDVGQCDPDHHAIRSMLTRHFDVEVDRVMFVNEALTAMREKPYDLVLVNRLIFSDNSEGLPLIETAKADDALKDVPIMMVSNFADAQATATQAGAEPGFGKSELQSERTQSRLRDLLPVK